MILAAGESQITFLDALAKTGRHRMEPRGVSTWMTSGAQYSGRTDLGYQSASALRQGSSQAFIWSVQRS
jgi:hypothetical protein